MGNRTEESSHHMASFTEDLAVEVWLLYSLGLILIGCRMAARRIHLRSFKNFQVDDYIMILVIGTFTGVYVTAFSVAHNGSNYVYLAPGTIEKLTPNEIKKAIYGSKMALVLEEFTITTLWLIKACILVMYSRLTLGLRENLAVKLLAAYCLFGFIVIQVLLLGLWCRPIQQYWAVPVKNSQCATYYHHMIVASVFNMSSDVLMLLVPLPLLIKSMMPLRRKIILCGLFSLGIFVILAAALNRYYNFTIKYSLIFLNWYVGEIATAVFVANIPLCWPLVRRFFRVDDFGNATFAQTGNSSASNRRFFPRNIKMRIFGKTQTETSSSNARSTPVWSERSGERSGGRSGERSRGLWDLPTGGSSDVDSRPNTGVEAHVITGMDLEQGIVEERNTEKIKKTAEVTQSDSSKL